eukprot:3094408-Pyramimonas_sp.AAC.1
MCEPCASCSPKMTESRFQNLAGNFALPFAVAGLKWHSARAFHAAVVGAKSAAAARGPTGASRRCPTPAPS